MPLVFVHGVNTRRTAGYDGSVAARDALFRQVFLPVAGLPDTVLRNPYWGDDGSRFAYDLGCVPTGSEDVVELGGEPGGGVPAVVAAAVASAPTTGEQTVLLDVARRDFVAAVDLLFAVTALTEGHAGEVAAAAAPASAYALRFERVPPGWTAEVTDDDEFVERLGQEIDEATLAGSGDVRAPEQESLGPIGTVWDLFREGAARIRHEAGAFIGRPAWELIRGMVVPTVPRFLGDVLVYLRNRGDSASPGPIATRVLRELRAAARERTDKDPLVVVGHSLGGVIAYDLLSGFAPDLSVDLFCTVGSQVALFEEMKLFEVSDHDVNAATGRTVRRPPAVRRWINVFDYNDVLSFKLQPVFADVDDYPYPTGSLLHAHGAYFGQPVFFRRLATRAREVLTS